MARPEAGHRLMSEGRAAFLASVMVILGPLSMSLYTPAMPALATALATTPAAIKLSMTIYLVGFALAQLLAGPLSDRFGRRPVLLGFTAIYVLGSLVAAAAQDVSGLLLGRAIQGVGACAGVALSRAVVRDCFDGQTGARLMATIAMFLSIAPALAPAIGSLLLAVAGWPAVFLAMAGYGATLAGITLAMLPETNRRPDPDALRPARMAGNYLILIGNPTYLRMVGVMAMAIGGIYSFHSISPFVYIEAIGLTPATFALVMLTSAGAFFTGARLVGHLLKRRPADMLIPYGLWTMAAGAVALSLGLTLHAATVPTVALPIMLWAFGAAFLLPGTTMGALMPFPEMAGAASALMGFLQMAAGVLGSAAASLFESSVSAMASVPLALAVLAVASFYGIGRPRLK